MCIFVNLMDQKYGNENRECSYDSIMISKPFVKWSWACISQRVYKLINETCKNFLCCVWFCKSNQFTNLTRELGCHDIWKIVTWLINILKVQHHFFARFWLWVPLTLNVRGPSHFGLTRSISWLLMPWLLTSPGHQQPWYWLFQICRSWS